MTNELRQHQLELEQNRAHWLRKPMLRRVYANFYREIAQRVIAERAGLVVELGSGMGNIKDHLPACITTDVLPNPWLDRVENAYALSFADGSLSHLILFDVWHHLEYPGEALREFARVLAPGGRVILFEPAMGLLGRFVFGCFHHEPLGLERPMAWLADAAFDPQAPRYYASQGNASRVFARGELRGNLDGWNVTEVAYDSALAYLCSGGFRGPQLAPLVFLPLLSRIDRMLSRFPGLASRMLVVLDKK